MDNPLFASLRDCKIFILCRLVPRPNGKSDKVPVNPRTLLPCDSQSSTNWMLPAEAVAHRARLGVGHCVGIVIVPGLFCIDLDGALQSDGSWSAFASALVFLFPGAYVEVSASGTGLHIMGMYEGTIPTHGTRDSANHMELYTKLRFIAIGDIHPRGEVLTNCTVPLLQVAAQYFPPHQDMPGGDAWTIEPRSDWIGTDDDDLLISKMLNARGSPATIFGTKASIRELWERDVDSLRASYLPEGPHQEFGYSGADQGLANHLAFYTGSNCERMLAIMMRSGLRRDKWEREDYIRSTIIKAAVSQLSRPPYRDHTMQVVAAVPASNVPEAGTVATAKMELTPGQFISYDEQLNLWAGMYYISDIHRIYLGADDGRLFDQQRFDAEFGGYRFLWTQDGSKPSSSAWDVFLGSQVGRFPRASGTRFDPRSTPGSLIYRDGLSFVNSWVPLNIPQAAGDPTPFVNHIKRCFPLGQDPTILLSYFAFLVQYKGVKAKWSILLQGVPGNGKSLLSKILEYCIGFRYTHHAKASEIDNRFNSALYGKLLVIVEDIKVTEAQASTWQTLLPMITETRMEIEGKGIDKVSREVCFNFIFNSNFKDAIRKTKDDRRIAPFFAAQQSEADLLACGMLNADLHTSDYFDALFTWLDNGGLPIIYNFLSTFDIPEEFNPATRCMRAPRTSSTQAAIDASMGSIEQEIVELVDQQRPGFMGGWISSAALDHMLTITGKARFIPHNKRSDMLGALGYVLHPGLPGGRSTAVIEGARPRLYIRKGHPSHAEVNTAAICAAYSAAQIVK